jgi:hypothetical protein
MITSWSKGDRRIIYYKAEEDAFIFRRLKAEGAEINAQ